MSPFWARISSLVATLVYRAQAYSLSMGTSSSGSAASNLQGEVTPLLTELDVQLQRHGLKLQQETLLLRAILRRWPWWLTGHLRLGELCLAQQDTLLAYGSAQAARQLAKSFSERLRAKMLLARCYLRSQRFALAEAELQQIKADACLNAALIGSSLETVFAEELAACALGRGDYKAALDLLSAVSTSKLSGEAQAALEYARGKVGNL